MSRLTHPRVTMKTDADQSGRADPPIDYRAKPLEIGAARLSETRVRK